MNKQKTKAEKKKIFDKRMKWIRSFMIKIMLFLLKDIFMEAWKSR